MLRLLGRLILWLWGWKLEGTDPGKNYKKLIYVVMPHTSNWDFLLGVSAMWAMPLHINWLGKHTLFLKPYGWFFKLLGGIPILRNKNQKYVESISEAFLKQDEMRLVIPAEGTRSPVEKIKTGFFHIAMRAQVPLAFIKIDAKNKVLYFSDVYHLKGDLEKDMAIINEYFKDGVGIIPEYGYLYSENAKKS